MLTGDAVDLSFAVLAVFVSALAETFSAVVVSGFFVSAGIAGFTDVSTFALSVTLGAELSVGFATPDVSGAGLLAVLSAVAFVAVTPVAALDAELVCVAGTSFGVCGLLLLPETGFFAFATLLTLLILANAR